MTKTTTQFPPAEKRAAPTRTATWMLSVLLAVGTAITAMLVAAPPAQAARGGGCTAYYAITACIPYHTTGGGQLRPDFYMNVTPDHSRCWAQMEIVTTNVGTTWSSMYRLNRTGRFGPLYVNVATLTASSGSAINRVHVYTCDWVAHGVYTSPRIYYP